MKNDDADLALSEEELASIVGGTQVVRATITVSGKHSTMTVPVSQLAEFKKRHEKELSQWTFSAPHEAPKHLGRR